MRVTVEIVPLERTCPDEQGRTHWFGFRVTNESGGRMTLGFEPTPELLEERWGFERDVFVETWSEA